MIEDVPGEGKPAHFRAIGARLGAYIVDQAAGAQVAAAVLDDIAAIAFDLAEKGYPASHARAFEKGARFAVLQAKHPVVH